MKYEDIEKMVREEFENRTKNDVEPIDPWAKKHYIHIATELAHDFYLVGCNKNPHEFCEYHVHDFVHGLTNIFFYGVYAGQILEKGE